MANAVDGSICIDTTLDDTGFQRGTNRLKKAIQSFAAGVDRIGSQIDKAATGSVPAIAKVQSQISGAKQRVDDLERAVRELGNAQIETEDYAQLKKQIADAESAMERLLTKEAKLNAQGVSEESRAWKSLQADIEMTRKQVAEYKADLAGLENSGMAYKHGVNTSEYAQLSKELETAKQQLAGYNAEAKQGSGVARTVASGLREAVSAAARFSKTLGGMAIKGTTAIFKGIASAAKQAAVQLGRMVGSTVISGLKKLGTLAANAARSFFLLGSSAKQSNAGVAGGLKTILKYGFGIRSVYVLVNKLRSAITAGVSSLAQQSVLFNAAMSSMVSALATFQNSIAAAFAPLIEVAAPILTKIINLLSTAATYLGMFFAAITGRTSFKKATVVTKDYAGSMDSAADAADNVGDAAKNAAEDVEEANKQLAAFDELNVLTDNSNSSGSGSGANGAGGGEDGIGGTDVLFENVPIESAILDFIDKVKDLWNSGDFEEIGELLADKINAGLWRLKELISWDRIGAELTRKIRAFAEIFNSLVKYINWDLMGSTIAEGINTLAHIFYEILTAINWAQLGWALAAGLNALIRDVDWVLLGNTLGAYWMAKISLLYEFTRNFDWAGLGDALGRFLNSVMGYVNWAMLGEAISNGLKGVLEALIHVVQTFNWVELGNQIAAFLSSIDWIGIVANLVALITATVNGMLSALSTAIAAFDWTQIGLTLAAAINHLVMDIDWAGAASLLGVLFAGAIETLKTTIIAIRWGDIGTVLANCLNNFLQQIPWSSIGTLVAQLFQGALQFLGNAITGFNWAELIAGLFAAISSFIQAVDWKQLGQMFCNDIIELLGSISQGIQNVEWQQLIHDLYQALSDFFSGVDWAGLAVSVAELLGSMLGAAVAAVVQLVHEIFADLWTAIKDNFTENGEFTWEGFKQGLLNGITGIGTWIKENIFTPFMDGFKSVFGIASPSTVMEEQGGFITAGLFNGISANWGSITAFFSDKLGTLEGTLSDTWESIKSTASQKWSAIKDTASSKWGDVENSITEKSGNAKTVTSTDWDSALKSTTTILGNVVSKVSTLWAKVLSHVVTNMDEATTKVRVSWSEMLQATSSTTKEIVAHMQSMTQQIQQTINAVPWTNLGTTIASGIYQGISGYSNMILSLMYNICNNVSSIVYYQYSWYNIGAYIAQGIANGINAYSGVIRNAAVWAAYYAYQAACDYLDIGSPSKLFRDEVGKWIPYGLAEGIEKNTDVAADAVSGLAEAVVQEADNADAAIVVGIDKGAGLDSLDGVLDSFAEKVSDSFASLIDKLGAIAESVTFSVPAVATGEVVPYAAASSGTGKNSQGGGTAEADQVSNDEMLSVIISTMNNVTQAIVEAIQKYSGTTVNIDKESLTDAVIEEINCRAIMLGQTPLLI